MTYIDDLTTARDEAASLLAAHISGGDVKPTYSVDGRSWDWAGYRDHLIENIDKLNDLIIKAGGAVEHRTIALG